MMTLPYKFLEALVLALALMATGYYLGKGHVQTETVFLDKIIEKQVEVHTQGETQIQFRDRIVTVTRTVLKDGTVTETTKTEEKSKDTDQKITKEKETHESEHVVASKEVSKPAPQAEYSLGLRYRVPASSLGAADSSVIVPADWRGIEVTAGRRVFGPIFVDVGVSGRRDISIGLRVDF